MSDVKIHSSKVTMMALDKLKPFSRNARLHDEAQIAALARVITDSGFTSPLLIDEHDTIIAGHGRWAAAEHLGMAKVPCVRVVGLSPEQVRALRVSDNKIALLSTWDEALLAAELGELKSLGFDMDLTGFDSSQIFGLLSGVKVGHTDPDDAPAAPADPVSRLGDTWIIGDHRIRCGSSTDPDDVAAVLAGGRPHLMVTDPPYGVNYDASWRRKAGVGGSGAAEGKVLNDDRADWREAWALFPGAVAYVWHDGLHAASVQLSLEATRFQVRAQIIWRKSRPILSRGAYHWAHEPALYAVREGEDEAWVERFEVGHEQLAFAVKDGATASWVGGRRQNTVWDIEVVRNDTGHSTQKPVACMQRPMENNSIPGDLIYEPFSGSGSCIMAGEICGRRVRAVELSPAYVDVAVKRWAAFTQREPVLEATGQTFAEVSAERIAAAHAGG